VHDLAAQVPHVEAPKGGVDEGGCVGLAQAKVARRERDVVPHRRANELVVDLL
jgi:hypothetical protein